MVGFPDRSTWSFQSVFVFSILRGKMAGFKVSIFKVSNKYPHFPSEVVSCVSDITIINTDTIIE